MGLAHLGLFSCPLCRKIMPVPEVLEHYEKEHNIKISSSVKRYAQKYVAKTYRTLSYEWGKPFWEVGRQRIPESEYQTALVHAAEQVGYVADEQGSPVQIANPEVFAYDVVRELRYQGLSPQYVRIDGATVLTQASGSPAPWYAYILALVLIAVIVYVFGQTFQWVIDALYRIFVAPIPPEWRPYVFGGLAICICIALIGYAVSRFRKR